MIKAGILELYWEERKNTERSKNVGKHNRLSFREFSKLCLIFEAKIITLSDVVLIYVEEIFKTIIN